MRIRHLAAALLLALAAIAVCPAIAQAPAPDLAKRVEFLEAAVKSYAGKLAQTQEQLVAAEATNAVLSRLLDEAQKAAAKQQPTAEAKPK